MVNGHFLTHRYQFGVICLLRRVCFCSLPGTEVNTKEFKILSEYWGTSKLHVSRNLSLDHIKMAFQCHGERMDTLTNNICTIGYPSKRKFKHLLHLTYTPKQMKKYKWIRDVNANKTIRYLKKIYNVLYNAGLRNHF